MRNVTRSGGQIEKGGKRLGYLLPVHEDHHDPEMERNFAHALLEAYEVFCERHEGYGRDNISEIGLQGVHDRMIDQFKRWENFLAGRGGDTQNERVEDIFIDLTNYPLIALLLHRGIWPLASKTKTLRQSLEAVIKATMAEYGHPDAENVAIEHAEEISDALEY